MELWGTAESRLTRDKACLGGERVPTSSMYQTPANKNRTRKPPASLTAKQYAKVTDTLASVRRNIYHENGDLSPRDEPSFIAEVSFTDAPLNSRVAPTGISAKSKGKAKVESLDRVPLEVQEAIILEDLLFVLIGIEGTYITFHPDYSSEDDYLMDGVKFAVADSIDPSLRDLVERILPLATYFTSVSAFIESRGHLEFGLVNHALCAAMRATLKEYLTLVAQLEHAFLSTSQFTLQKLWFYVHPTLHTLALLHGLVVEIASVDVDAAGSDEEESGSEMDEEERARQEALGLGGAGLKAVLSDLKAESSASSGGIAKGGEILAILHERMEHMSGDPAAHDLFKSLLRLASVPYAQLIETWISTGRLLDPQEELCVKEAKFIDTGILEQDTLDQFWERRYTLRDGSTFGTAKRQQAGVPALRKNGGRLPGGACIPPLLEEWKHKILLAGKYLNVIRECGVELSRQTDRSADTELGFDDPKFYTSIEDSYTRANTTLLRMLMDERQLVPRLRSIKRYFLLSQSSFLIYFFDAAQVELRKSARSASLVRLQSILDIVLNTDAHDDPYREDVKTVMATSGLYDFLSRVLSVNGVIEGDELGSAHEAPPESAKEKENPKDKDKEKKPLLAHEAFMLDYTVKFPLSLILSRKAIVYYQILFRFLWHLKHVEQALSAMWIEQKTSVWRSRVAAEYVEFERWRTRVHVLRSRMLAFVQHVLAFVTFEVLEPNWRNLEEKLKGAKTVDQLLRDHADFQATCLNQCMLTSSRLLRVYSRLIVTCGTFALYASQFSKSAQQAISAFDTGTESSTSSTAMDKRWQFLDKFESNFNHWFKVHLDHVQYHASSENVAILPLMMRLSAVKNGMS